VRGEAVGPAGDEGEQDEWQAHRRGDDVGDEQEEINAAHRARAAVARRVVGHVIGDVGQQEQHG